MNSVAILKPRKQTKLGMALVDLTKGASFWRQLCEHPENSSQRQ
jgi:hypothetical protein